MNRFPSLLKNLIYLITAVLAGFCLFITQVSFSVDKTILNSEFHKKMFLKHNIYSHAHDVVSSSIKEFAASLKMYSPQYFEQHKEIFALLEASITPDMVRSNLDSIREGLFQYFKGEARFLPDIYLNMADRKPGDSEGQAVPSLKNESSSSALAKIDKINLSAVLLYINRSDIADSISAIKLFYYIIGKLPEFSMLFLVILVLAGLTMCRKSADFTKWAEKTLLAAGILSLSAGIWLLLYAHVVMPKNIYPVVMSLPLHNKVIIDYVQESIMPVSFSLIISGLVFVLLSCGVFFLPRIMPAFFTKKFPYILFKRFQRDLFLFLIFILVVSIILFKLQILKKDFESYNFAAVISKLRKANAVTQVISAKDEAVYTLQIKLVDTKTKKPAGNIPVNVSGRSGISYKYYNETAATDDTGVAKFKLDKGTFHLKFIPDRFPEEYQMPSPFFFDLKTAGTTIITVNLDELEKEKWGAAEIEVLDKNNKPVPGLELEVDGDFTAPGDPDKVRSYTNSEGIAVFKLGEGSYIIKFTETKLPKKFRKPSPLSIEITPGSVTRYTVRLVETGKN